MVGHFWLFVNQIIGIPTGYAYPEMDSPIDNSLFIFYTVTKG
jgi:hypothetical protein